MIKAIIFDCFGVLTTEGFDVFRDKYFGDSEDKRQQANGLMDRVNVADITYEEFVRGLAKLAGISVSVVDDYLDKSVPNEPLFEYIRSELKPKYKIGFLSNAGGDWVNEMFEPEDVALFDDIVLSFREGVIKPNPEIFKIAARNLGVETSECVFIDDKEKHCIGARQAGMAAFVYESVPKLKGNLEKVLSTVSDN